MQAAFLISNSNYNFKAKAVYIVQELKANKFINYIASQENQK